MQDTALYTNDELLKDSIIVHFLLEKIQLNNPTLTIRIAGSDIEFSGTLLCLDKAGKYLDIDVNRLEFGKLNFGNIIVMTKLKDADVCFESTLIKTIGDHAWQGYRVKFPESILYQERRSTYRIPIAEQLNINADIYCHTKEIITTKVMDISRKGMGLATKVEHADKLMQEKSQLHCDIDFDDNTGLSCNIVLCHEGIQEHERSTHIGARFVDLSKSQAGQLLAKLRLLDEQQTPYT